MTRNKRKTSNGTKKGKQDKESKTEGEKTEVRKK